MVFRLGDIAAQDLIAPEPSNDTRALVDAYRRDPESFLQREYRPGSIPSNENLVQLTEGRVKGLRGLASDLDEGFASPVASDAGPITPGPGILKTLDDARTAGGISTQAGLGDIGQEKLHEWLYPAPMPQDPRAVAYKNQQAEAAAQQAWDWMPDRMGGTVAPDAYDEGPAAAQAAREAAARRQRGEIAPSAAVERRFPRPSTAEAYRMGGLADMQDYNESDPLSAYGAYDKHQAALRRLEAAPDLGGPLIPSGPQVSAGHPAVNRAVDIASELGAGVVIPQSLSPLDIGLTVTGGPVGGRFLRGGAAALGALFEPDAAEAGVGSKLVKLLAGKPGGPWEGGIRAYHSSPHDFDKFDWSKLRTGEGANVYGAGFYAAENPAVSGQGGEYWKAFSHRFGGPEGQAVQRLEGAGFDRGQALEAVKRDLKRAQEEPVNKMYGDFARQSHIEMLQAQQKLLESGAPVGPRTYEVNINARPELLLDWDKPLHAQAHMVEPLNKAGFNLSPAVGDLSYLTQKAAAEGPDSWYAAQLRAVGDMRNKTGAEFMPKTPEAAVALREAGIPGIRYLDQGSRVQVTPEAIANLQASIAKKEAAHQANPWLIDAEKNTWGARNQSALDEERRQLDQMLRPSYNYVVTDPSKLDILAKYGVVGSAGGGLGALAAQDEYQR